MPPRDAVQKLEDTRQQIIKKLLEKRRAIEDQLERLGHAEQPKAPLQ